MGRERVKTDYQAGSLGGRVWLGAYTLDTMFLMGFKSEYERGRKWILKRLEINVVSLRAFECI